MSTPNPAATPQSAPTGLGIEVTPLVLADLRARSDAGLLKYGTRLRAHNGRDALLDAYQEALDLACYLRQAIAERGPAMSDDAKIETTTAIRVDAYGIVERAVEEGVAAGWHRAHKHTDNPLEGEILECIERAVTGALCEVLDFDPGGER